MFRCRRADAEDVHGLDQKLAVLDNKLKLEDYFSFVVDRHGLDPLLEPLSYPRGCLDRIVSYAQIDNSLEFM